MPQATISFSEEEDQKIEKYSKKWDIAKYRVVRRMVQEFKEDKK